MALLSAFLASASFGTARDFLESPVRTHPCRLPCNDTNPRSETRRTPGPGRIGGSWDGVVAHQPAAASTLAVSAFSMAPASAETTKGLVR